MCIALVSMYFSFASGAGDSGGHLAEGLSTALQLFDELEQLREPKSVTRSWTF
jgi:hypothetical protein